MTSPRPGMFSSSNRTCAIECLPRAGHPDVRASYYKSARLSHPGLEIKSHCPMVSHQSRPRSMGPESRTTGRSPGQHPYRIWSGLARSAIVAHKKVCVVQFDNDRTMTRWNSHRWRGNRLPKLNAQTFPPYLRHHAEKTLQVSSFRECDKSGMVYGVQVSLDDLDASLSLGPGESKKAQKCLVIYRRRTRGTHQYPARP